MIKQADPSAAWGSSPKGSYWNTANPLSQSLGLTDRLPEGWVKMFPNTTGGQRAAHITFKAGMDALIAAGLVAVWRGLSHINRMSELAKSDNPAHGMKSQLSTTFAGSLNPDQKKTASELAQPAVFSTGNALSTALPLGAVLLATSLAYRATDDYLDQKRNKALDVAIKSKENVLKRLIKTRSRLAKGNATDSEVRNALGGMTNEDLYVKQASQEKQALWPFDQLSSAASSIAEGTKSTARMTVGGFATLSCLILGAAAVGSYYYFSKADEDNVRYRAMKKGLKEYARVKSGYTPIAIIPTKSRKFFAEIDQENAAQKKQKKQDTGAATPDAAPVTTARQEQPVLTETYNKPISLTL
jgi:hypothetical protein